MPSVRNFSASCHFSNVTSIKSPTICSTVRVIATGVARCLTGLLFGPGVPGQNNHTDAEHSWDDEQSAHGITQVLRKL
jgi:hypothetical protein